MTKARMIIINALFWLVCMKANDYTLAVIATLYSLPELFEIKNKRRVKYE